MNLVNWVQGASKHKPTLYGLQGTGCEDIGIIHTCALQEELEVVRTLMISYVEEFHSYNNLLDVD